MSQLRGDSGIGDLVLLCPERHIVGQIVKNFINNPIQYVPAGGPWVEWPGGQHSAETHAFCAVCGRSVGASTSLLQTKMAQLVDDEWDWQGQSVLDWRGENVTGGESSVLDEVPE